MSLPFSVEQFLSVFRDYNMSIWPVQVLAYVISLFIVWLSFTKLIGKDRMISTLLAVFWLWNGAAYHIGFFSGINKAAYLFGALFIMQSIMLLIVGTLHNRIKYRPGKNLASALAMVLITYASIIYPLLGYVLGHQYPNSPLLGVAPCPTTIFTFGMLLLAKDSLSVKLCLIPLLWSLIGFSASWTLGILEDIGLFVSGLVSVALIVHDKYLRRIAGSGDVMVEK